MNQDYDYTEEAKRHDLATIARARWDRFVFDHRATTDANLYGTPDDPLLDNLYTDRRFMYPHDHLNIFQSEREILLEITALSFLQLVDLGDSLGYFDADANYCELREAKPIDIARNIFRHAKNNGRLREMRDTAGIIEYMEREKSAPRG
jgi:hypothetical protein